MLSAVLNAMGDFWSLITCLHIEPIVAMAMTAILARNSATQQLLQDKLCSFKYHLNDEYCLDLASQPDSRDKNHILTDVTAYMSGKELIALLPHLTLTLFAASWCDRYPNGRRYLIMASIVGQLLETILMMFNAVFYDWNYQIIIFSVIPSAFLGNGFIMASYSYMSAKIVAEKRAVRFLVLDVFLNVGMVAGYVCGGYIVSQTSILLPSVGLRNYGDIFIMSFLLLVLCLIWTWFRVQETEVLQETETVTDDNDAETISDDRDTESVESELVITFHQSGSGFKNCIRSIISLFSLQDIKDMWRTVTKERPNHDVRNMWLMIGVHFSLMLPSIGLSHVIFPMVEKLYFWDFSTYTYNMALFMALKPVIVSLYIAYVVKKLDLHPLTIIMMGVVPAILAHISFASIQSPVGFYMESVVGTIAGTATSGVRTFLSLTIPGQEITKVFCILQEIETLLPLFSTAVVAAIFKATIHFDPTLVVHIFAFLEIISLAVVCGIDLSIRKEVDERKRQESHVKTQSVIEEETSGD